MSFNTCSKCRRLIPMGTGNRCPGCKPKRVKSYNPRAKGMYDHTYITNRRILLAQDDMCWLCNRRGADTADHVLPLSRGGTNDLANLKPAHQRCNSGRGNRPA